MQLKVANRVISKYSDITVSLRYDSVGSTFAVTHYYDPSNADDRKLFVPGNYNIAQLTYNGEVLITGVLLSEGLTSTSTEQLMRIAGYSKSGVIDDCQNPPTTQPQSIGTSLAEIAKSLINPFGLQLIISNNVTADANKPYPNIPTFEPETTIKDYLTQLAIQRNIVLSHDNKGNLLLTRANTNQEPIYNFSVGSNVIDMSLLFDGQRLHSEIFVVGDAGIGSPNASQDSIKNPYVQAKLDWMGNARLSTLGQSGIAYSTGYRPCVYKQTSGTDNETKLTARQILAQELKAGIRLTIKIEGWELGGKLVRPNNVITVTNPQLSLFQKSKWFIESVDFMGNSQSKTAVLNCVLPECYNNENVVNIFTGTNLTVPYSETGAKATITPFL